MTSLHLLRLATILNKLQSHKKSQNGEEGAGTKRLTTVVTLGMWPLNSVNDGPSFSSAARSFKASSFSKISSSEAVDAGYARRCVGWAIKNDRSHGVLPAGVP